MVFILVGCSTKEKPSVSINHVVSTTNRVSFEINVMDNDDSGTISAIELYHDDELVDSLSDLSKREFTDLYSNNDYIIKVIYTYKLKDKDSKQHLTVTHNVKTQSIATPAIEIVNPTTIGDVIDFEINVTDNDDSGTISAIELYKDNELINSLTDLSKREFKGVLTDSNYLLKVTYSYNLNDGSGEKQLIEYCNIYLKPNVVPTMEIKNLSSSQDRISFNLNITDNDNVGSIGAIELYKDDELIDSLTDFTTREFIGLLSNTSYTVKAIYTYNLNDGSGEKQIIQTESVNTTRYHTPSVYIENSTSTIESISFEVRVNDHDEVGMISAIKLYNRDELVESLSDLSVREFTGLLSNTMYTIEAIYTYDLNDGLGPQQVVGKAYILTFHQDEPTI